MPVGEGQAVPEQRLVEKGGVAHTQPLGEQAHELRLADGRRRADACPESAHGAVGHDAAWSRGAAHEPVEQVVDLRQVGESGRRDGADGALSAVEPRTHLPEERRRADLRPDEPAAVIGRALQQRSQPVTAGASA